MSTGEVALGKRETRRRCRRRSRAGRGLGWCRARQSSAARGLRGQDVPRAATYPPPSPNGSNDCPTVAPCRSAPYRWAPRCGRAAKCEMRGRGGEPAQRGACRGTFAARAPGASAGAVSAVARIHLWRWRLRDAYSTGGSCRDTSGHLRSSVRPTVDDQSVARCTTIRRLFCRSLTSSTSRPSPLWSGLLRT